jgi:alkylation response protein AidB-like acyl-CoA dehydrogenase
VLVTLSAAKAALHESWANADDPLVATVARSIAGRAHAEASRHGQQVCGGIGFTWEFGLHAYIRRGGLLDTLLGSWRGQRVSVGEHVIAAGEAPRVRCL